MIPKEEQLRINSDKLFDESNSFNIVDMKNGG